MDDKLILSVFNFPELYNVTLPNYRCIESRNNAWRNISTLVGLPSEECKRKWKNLRDRYLKEVRSELKTKQQGELIPSRWKYRQLLNFIAPFTGTRNTLDLNNDDEDDDETILGSEAGDADGETSEAARMALASMKASSEPHKSQMAYLAHLSTTSPARRLAFLTKLPPGTPITPMPKAGRKCRDLPPPSAPAPKSKRQAKAPAPKLPTRPRDEDEMFLLSFVPALKRLPPQKRCETKIKIQRVMYEAEFSAEQPKPPEKPSETEESETET